MKNSKQGFVISIIIAIIVLLLIGGGIYYYTNTLNNTGEDKSSVLDTSNWETYTNDALGYSISYPKGWLNSDENKKNDRIVNPERSGIPDTDAPVEQLTIRLAIDNDNTICGKGEYSELNGYPVFDSGWEKGFGLIYWRTLCQKRGSLFISISVFDDEKGNIDEESKNIFETILSTIKFGNPTYEFGGSVQDFSISVTGSPSINSTVSEGSFYLQWYGCSKDINIALVRYVDNSQNKTASYPVVSGINVNSFVYDSFSKDIPSGKYRFWISSNSCGVGKYSDIIEYISTVDTTEEYPEGKPIIESISPTFGPIGTKVTIAGKNLAGFEGDLVAIFEGEDGRKITLWDGSLPDGEINLTIQEPCEKGEIVHGRYSGIPEECKYVEFTPGVYKVYTEPWGKRSNEVEFTVTN